MQVRDIYDILNKQPEPPIADMAKTTYYEDSNHQNFKKEKQAKYAEILVEQIKEKRI